MLYLAVECLCCACDSIHCSKITQKSIFSPMASSSHNPCILLKRTLSLADPSAFILNCDSISQTSHYLVNEVVHNISTQATPTIIYIAFENLNRPTYATHFIDVNEVGIAKVADTVGALLPTGGSPTREKNLVIVDSLNHIALSNLGSFVSSLVNPHCTLLATLHKDLPEQQASRECDNYPSAETLLQYMATSILDIDPCLPPNMDEEELRSSLDKFHIPKSLNNPTFKVTFTNKRRSGRSVIHTLIVDTVKHSYELASNIAEESELETPEMLQGLTTFNLSTSAKQKEAKDQVALPFLEAQSEFAGGTAIVYEYEKDDDYDEEDPYEDPF